MADHRKAIIGSNDNFWLYSTQTGFDLTHPPKPSSFPIYPRLTLEASTARVTIDPRKTALLIVDMQNFFLSPQLGRSNDSNGLKACDVLVRKAIPACRKAGIRIVWLNWGLTEDELAGMPPATLRAFGFETVSDVGDDDDLDESNGSPNPPADNLCMDTGTPKHVQVSVNKDPKIYRGLGSEMGPVVLEDGSTVEGGRLLMRDQWNSALPPRLEAVRLAEDIWIHKNRMSGLWGHHTDCSLFLEKEDIRTLLFAGVNTDQCVGGTLQDAFSKGWDCIMLSDTCATTSPSFAQDCIEYNTAKTYGFVIDSATLAKGVDGMEFRKPS